MVILVASRGPSLAMILGMAGYDVLDARPGDAREWGRADPLPACDVVVLDLDDRDLCRSAVRAARDTENPPRVLLVTGNPHEWSDIEGPDLLTVQPPLSRDSISGAIQALTSPPPSTVDQPSATSLADHVPDVTTEVPVQPVAPASEASSLAPPLSRAAEDLRAQAMDAMTLSEVASEVCALVVEQSRADAACLLLPDAERWRVAGGANLRPLEYRIEIDAAHWLIKEMLRSVKGAVIDRSDVARSQLMHSPLAWQAQVAFVTYRALGAVLIVGRQSGTFSEPDLAYLLGLLGEAAPHLQQALSLRHLARDLERFRDLP